MKTAIKTTATTILLGIVIIACAVTASAVTQSWEEVAAAASSNESAQNSVNDSLTPKYKVARVGSELHVTFYEFATVRIHTSSKYAPYLDKNVSKNHKIIVKNGQWLELKVNGRWSFFKDADNR